MTFARFSTDDRTGRIRGYVGEGRFTNDPLSTFGGAGVVEIRRLQDLLHFICANGFEHHVASTSRQSPMPCTRRRRAISAGKYRGIDDADGRPEADGSKRTPCLIVAGVDFGTQSVRVSLVDSARGPLGGVWPSIPVKRDRNDPDFATQSHEAHMSALVPAMQTALERRRHGRTRIEALALDTTGSTVIPVGTGLVPLDDYYFWCDHRAHEEAALITRVAKARVPRRDRRFCGGVYSSEWGFAKLLHWLRHNPDKRGSLVAALEHCDMVAGVLCGITDHRRRAAQHLRDGAQVAVDDGDLPPRAFSRSVDPLLAGARDLLRGTLSHVRSLAGTPSTAWAEKLGLCARGSRSPSARSTRTGTRSAPVSPRATW